MLYSVTDQSPAKPKPTQVKFYQYSKSYLEDLPKSE